MHARTHACRDSYCITVLLKTLGVDKDILENFSRNFIACAGLS
jgi:hypothetical protein